jgi:ABC-2 type transport system permease protein
MRSLKVTYAIWLREVKLAARERARIIATVAQPLIYLAILGRGITSGMRLTSAGNVDYIKFMYPGVIGMSILFTSIFSPFPSAGIGSSGSSKGARRARAQQGGGDRQNRGRDRGARAGGYSDLLRRSGISLSFSIVVRCAARISDELHPSLGIIVASWMGDAGFQMVMNFLVMPLYFLSGAMFPMASAPGWMKNLMMADPLTYGVDAIRNVVFSNTMIADGAVMRPLVEVARQSGLIRWTLAFDITLMSVTALILATMGAWAFSKSQAT